MTFSLNPLNWGKPSSSSDYESGYNAAGEFLDLISDHNLTDEEANAQWDAVESGHSEEYVQGYVDYFDKPWWKFW